MNLLEKRETYSVSWKIVWIIKKFTFWWIRSCLRDRGTHTLLLWKDESLRKKGDLQCPLEDSLNHQKIHLMMNQVCLRDRGTHTLLLWKDESLRKGRPTVSWKRRRFICGFELLKLGSQKPTDWSWRELNSRRLTLAIFVEEFQSLHT